MTAVRMCRIGFSALSHTVFSLISPRSQHPAATASEILMLAKGIGAWDLDIPCPKTKSIAPVHMPKQVRAAKTRFFLLTALKHLPSFPAGFYFVKNSIAKAKP
jgi:hypothetical protein